MARVKVTTDRNSPPWGSTKRTAKKLQKERDAANRLHALEVEIEQTRAKWKEERVKLAHYIFEWLGRRNGAELFEALDRQRIGDRRLAIDELAEILATGGRPPNWVKP